MLLVIAILVASWSADSHMAKFPWVPDQMGAWADQTPNARTAVPFGMLSVLLACGLPLRAVILRFGIALLLSLVVLVAAEVGQFFLPFRTPDWRDIAWGSLGILSGLIAAGVFAGIRHFVARPNPPGDPPVFES